MDFSWFSIPTTSTVVLPFVMISGTICVAYWSGWHPELNKYLSQNLFLIKELIAKGYGEELNALYKIF